MTQHIATRKMAADDVSAAVKILNHIIALGGSTAYEHPFTEAKFTTDYLNGAAAVHVAESAGRVTGFQAVFDDGPGVYSIATFADQQAPVRGTGSALFRATRQACGAMGGTVILAKITSDNTGGLAYYSKMGFRDQSVVPGDHTRSDGTVVDRIIKSYALSP